MKEFCVTVVGNAYAYAKIKAESEEDAKAKVWEQLNSTDFKQWLMEHCAVDFDDGCVLNHVQEVAE